MHLCSAQNMCMAAVCTRAHVNKALSTGTAVHLLGWWYDAKPFRNMQQFRSFEGVRLTHVHATLVTQSTLATRFMAHPQLVLLAIQLLKATVSYLKLER